MPGCAADTLALAFSHRSHRPIVRPLRAGIDGRYVRYTGGPGGGPEAYAVDPSVGIPQTARDLIRRLCELGWLFRKVQAYVSRGLTAAEGDVSGKTDGAPEGSVQHALCSALQQELSDYYRLVALLEQQALQPIPTPSQMTGGATKPYLTLRRLATWLSEPLQRMRVLAVVVDAASGRKGGALLQELHLQSQHGDPAVESLVTRILGQAFEPILGMIRDWLLRGELQDPHGEFFVQHKELRKGPEGASDLWRHGYALDLSQLPPFVSERLATEILRCGRTINLLRRTCGDTEWSKEGNAANEEAALDRISYPLGQALEAVVEAMASRLDRRLREILANQFLLMDHLNGLKRYLLLCQGDFVRSLIEAAKQDLSAPARELTEFRLAGALAAAVRYSNAQFDLSEVLSSLRVRMLPGTGTETGWDVFQLRYEPSFRPHTLGQYDMTHPCFFFHVIFAATISRRLSRQFLLAMPYFNTASYSTCFGA